MAAVWQQLVEVGLQIGEGAGGDLETQRGFLLTEIRRRPHLASGFRQLQFSQLYHVRALVRDNFTELL
jgi:hypothetical protein